MDKNLLRRDEADADFGPPHVVMLETIREYGLERLQESGEAERMRARHARFFLDLAEAAAPALNGPDQRAWTNLLEQEHDNLRAALAWACDQDDAGTGLRFAAALWRFWSMSGHGLEAQRWLERVLTLSVTGNGPEPDAKVKVMALIGAATLALERSAFEDAAAMIADCLTIARSHDSESSVVDALDAAGLIARTRGEYDAATQALEEAYQLATATGYRAGEATSLYELAMVIFLTGDASRAQVLLERSISLHRDLGDVRGLAAGLRDLGWMIWHAGDAVRGEELREEALALFRALGDTGQVAETLWALGISAQYRGNPMRATALYEESLALRRSRGDERGAAQVLSTLAQLSLHQRDLPLARAKLTEALETGRWSGDRWGEAMMLALVGHLELVSGDLPSARRRFVEAATHFAAIGNLLYLPWCLEGFAGIAMAAQRVRDAAFLLGARETTLEIVGRGLPPADPPGFENTQVAARTALVETDFNEAYEAGCSLSLDDIVALLTQPQMPFEAAPLTQSQIAAIRGWIAEGAPKN